MALTRQRRQLAVTALAVIGGLSVVACSPVARYQVMSFVFDGVPPPAGIEQQFIAAQPRQETVVSSLEQARRVMAARRAEKEPTVTIVSSHEPYEERRCDACHDLSRGEANDVAKDASLCDKCHLEKRQQEEWDHGPINLGSCIPCHVPHNSPNPSLLSQPMLKLCLDCHTQVVAGEPQYHDVPNFTDCVACHDPHRMY